ncbi:MAG: hypothetical protein QW429_00745 [Thermoprotei archaeon]
MALRFEGWMLLFGFTLALFVYTQARYWLVDAALLGLACAYLALWSINHVTGASRARRAKTNGRARSRVLYYARFGDFKHTQKEVVATSRFEHMLVEALSTAGSLEGALSLVLSSKPRFETNFEKRGDEVNMD